jgi:hypothetical protein
MDEMPYVDKKGLIYKYGEFFPMEMSPHAYNESFANEHFPLTKEEVEKMGLVWRDISEKHFDITISGNNLPDDIKDVDDSITKEVIGCAHAGTCNHECAGVFKITKQELQFYKLLNIPLPRICQNCRHYARFAWRNPAKLWKRQCHCGGLISADGIYQNTAKHVHENGKCPNEFETSYSPDRKEIIYCEQCFNSEVA